MLSSFNPRNQHLGNVPSLRRQRGYILLLLLLAVALMSIAAITVVTKLEFELKRDREEEMIHRGVQYSRAIQRYYKKFGRYPTKLEDLESANNMRFLRKRYKDPITGKDFKLLHYGEVQLLSGIGGLANVNAMPGQPLNGGPGGLNPGLNPGGLGPSNGLGGNGFGANTGFGNNPNSAFGQNSQQNGLNPPPNGTDAAQNGQSPDNPQPGNTNPANGTPSDNSGGDNATGTGSGSGNAPTPLGGQVFGGAILGVASVSKQDTIREYNHKKKYKDWYFVYDPALDRGQLINTPYQPSLAQGLGGMNMGGVNPNGVNPNGQNGSSFGNGNGFGNAFGNSAPGQQNNPQPNPGPGTPGQQGNPTQ